MKISKKFLSICLAVVMLLTVTACSGKSCGKDGGKIEFLPEPSPIPDTAISFADNGKSDYKIVIPKEAKELETYAAEEMANFVKQSTGCILPIVNDEGVSFDKNSKTLSIGETTILKGSGVKVDKVALNTDGFALVRKENTVILAGGSEKGTVFAVYEFLRLNLGYEFYAINETAYKEVKSVKLKDFNIFQAPTFKERTSYYRVVTDSKRENLRLRTGKGDEWGLFAHSAFTLISPDKYKADHRDWFSGWENTENFDEEKEMQLCLTNEEMRQELVKNLEKIILEKPDKKYFMVGQMDKPYFCQCSHCKPSNEKYTNTGTMMRFINAVARDIKKWQVDNNIDREIYVATFAYHETKYAPAKYIESTKTYEPIDPSVVAEDNVLVQFAPLEACFAHSLNSDCNAVFRTAINGWKVVCKNMAIWSYCAFFSNYQVNLNNWGSIQENYRIFKDMNAMIVFDQGAGETQSSPFEALRAYISSKLLWNVDEDVNLLTKNFMKNYYKEVAGEMTEYYNLYREHYASLEAESQDEEHSDFCARVSTIYDTSFLSSKTFPKGLLLNLLNILERAEAKVNAMPDSPYKTEMHFRVVAETLSPIALLLTLHDGTYTQSQLSDLVDRLEETAAEVGLVHWSEAKRIGTMIAEFKQQFGLN